MNNQVFERGTKIEPTVGYIPSGPALTAGGFVNPAKFLQLEEETVQFVLPEGQEYEVRWLGFGYFLVTPLGMAEQCGTEEEVEYDFYQKEYEPGKFRKEARLYPSEKYITPPFIMWNGEDNEYTYNKPEVV